MSRRRAREAALRTLFQIDFSGTSADAALKYNIAEMELGEAAGQFAVSLVEGTIDRLHDVDRLIKSYAKHWSIERMARTDRNILRMAVYEMYFQGDVDVPENVAINEAVELAKRYGEADSGKFVNGILGQMIQKEEF